MCVVFKVVPVKDNDRKTLIILRGRYVTSKAPSLVKILSNNMVLYENLKKNLMTIFSDYFTWLSQLSWKVWLFWGSKLLISESLSIKIAIFESNLNEMLFSICQYTLHFSDLISWKFFQIVLTIRENLIVFGQKKHFSQGGCGFKSSLSDEDYVNH